MDENVQKHLYDVLNAVDEIRGIVAKHDSTLPIWESAFSSRLYFWLIDRSSTLNQGSAFAQRDNWDNWTSFFYALRIVLKNVNRLIISALDIIINNN